MKIAPLCFSFFSLLHYQNTHHSFSSPSFSFFSLLLDENALEECLDEVLVSFRCYIYSVVIQKVSKKCFSFFSLLRYPVVAYDPNATF